MQTLKLPWDNRVSLARENACDSQPSLSPGTNTYLCSWCPGPLWLAAHLCLVLSWCI